MPGPFTLPPFPVVDERLDNGLRVVVSEDHTVPVVAVNLWYDVGSRHEVAGRTGLAHLFEHLMFEGSAHVPGGQHFQLVHAAGGTLNATTSLDRTNYFETLPSHHLDLALWLEADRMGALALDQERLDNQRDVVRNERRQRYDNQPYGTWLERLLALAFPPGHPYHHATIGSMQDLAAASLADVQAFFATHYAPDNAVLTVAGDAEPAQVGAGVQRYFGGLPRGASRPGPPDGTLPRTAGGEAAETVRERVPDPRIFVGFRVPPAGTRDFDVATVLAAVLGAGRGSRLHRELVLERRLAQASDGAMLDGWPLVGGAALLIGDAAAREGVAVEELTAAYHEVVASVAASGVSDDELARAQAQVASEWCHHVSSLDGRADLLSMYATLFDDPGLVNEQLPRLLTVTAAEVRELAAELLVPDNRVVVTFVPEEGQ